MWGKGGGWEGVPSFCRRYSLAFPDSILTIHFTGCHRNACLPGRSLVIERELVITPSDAVRPLCSVKLSPGISFGKAFFFELLSVEQCSVYFLSQMSIQGNGRRGQKWFHRSRREMKGYLGTRGQVDKAKKPNESMCSLADTGDLLNIFYHNFYFTYAVIFTLLSEQKSFWYSMTLYSMSKCSKATLIRSLVSSQVIP